MVKKRFLLVLFFLVSLLVGFSVVTAFKYAHSARFLSIFLPEKPKLLSPVKSVNPEKTFFYGVNVDMSQILPSSEHYIVNSKGEDLIDIAARLGVNFFRITNNTRSFKGQGAIYSQEQWASVLGKMQAKNIKALIVIETTSAKLPDYLTLVRQYIIDSGVLAHPDVYAIDLKNEPVINDSSVEMMRTAASMVKAKNPKMRLTVGWWAVDGGDKLIWDDYEAGRRLDDFIDFYSIHLYGFDESTFGFYPDSYSYTDRQVLKIKSSLQTSKPILIEEFGAGNGQAVSDQETLGSPELQANTFNGVYHAIRDMEDPQILGAVAYQFHSQSNGPDAWAIVADNGNYFFPAAYVLQQFATGKPGKQLTLPLMPVPNNYFLDNGDNNRTLTIKKGDIVGVKLVLDKSNQYTASVSGKPLLLTYDPEREKYYAVWQAWDAGEAQIVIKPAGLRFPIEVLK